MKKGVLIIIFVFVLIFINSCENYPYFTSKSISVIEISDISKTNETNISLPTEDISYPTEDISGEEIQPSSEVEPEIETPSIENIGEEIIIEGEEGVQIEEPKIVEEDKRVTYLKRIFEFPEIDFTEKLKNSFQIIIPNKIKELFSDIKYDFDIKLPFFKLKEYRNEIFKNKFIKDNYNIIDKENIFIPDLNLRVKDYLIIDNVRLPLYKGKIGGILIRKESLVRDNGGKIIYGFKNNDKNKDIQFLWEIKIPKNYYKINKFNLNEDFTDYSGVYKLYGENNYRISFRDVKDNFYGVYALYNKDTRILSVYSAKRFFEIDEEIILDPEWQLNVTYDLEFVSWVGYHTPMYIDVDTSGYYIYVGTNAFVIEDITDKANPVEASHLRPLETGAPESIVTYENYAYAFWSTKGVRVIDISDKTNPEIVSTNFDPAYHYSLLEIQYPYLYAYVFKKDINYHQLHVIDISDPTNPVLYGSYDLSGPGFVSTQGLEFTDAVFDEDYVYITIGQILGNGIFTDGAQLLVLNVADPSNPSLVGSPLVLGDLNTGQNEYYRRYLQLDKKDNYLYITGYFANPNTDMKIVDVLNPSNLVIVNNAWSLSTPHDLADIDIEGNYAYVTGYSNNVFILDLLNPLNPQEMDNFNLPLPDYYEKIFDIKVKGNYAYLKMWDNYAIYIYDVSNINNPQLVSMIPFGHDHSDVSAPPGDYAFVSIWDYLQFYTVDMSNPQLPIITNREETRGGGMGLDVKGDYAYLVMGSDCSWTGVPCGGLHIYDIINPNNPVFVGNSPATSGGCDIQVYVDTSEMKAYVVDGESIIPNLCQSLTPGLRIIDVSDPSNPVQLGRYNIPIGEGTGLSIHKSENYAYLAGKQGGLYIIDVSDSTNPILAAQWIDSSVPILSRARGVFVKDNYAYLTYGESLRILDVSNPTTPTEVANYPFNAESKDVVVDGDYAYVITFNSLIVLDIFDVSNPFEVASQVDVFSFLPTRIDVNGEYIYVIVHNGGLYTFRFEAQTTTAPMGPSGGSSGGGSGSSSGGPDSGVSSPIITTPIIIGGNQSNESLYQIESPLSLYTIDFANQDVLEIELEEKNYLLKIDNNNYALVVNEINKNNVNLQIDSKEIDLTYDIKGAFNLINNKRLYVSLLSINNDKAKVRFEVLSELPLVEEKPKRTTIGDLITSKNIIISSIIIFIILIGLIGYYIIKIRGIKKGRYNKEEVMKTIKDALAKGYLEEQIKVKFMRGGWEEKEIDKLLKKLK